MQKILATLLIALTCLASGQASAQMTRPETRATSGTFSEWQSGFRAQALAAGITAQVFDAAFKNARYNPQTRASDANQAEFVRPIWDYLDSAVSSRNITTGRQKATEFAPILQAIARKYRVPAPTLLAIWSMETNYGSFRGTTNTIEALANAAHDGRRQEFAKTELIAALKILTSGEITPATMLGGWSGAMGHTQFMPSTYLRYAVDQNGDGRRDVWSDDPTDALASTANYLQILGWDNHAPWGVEVTLPRNFDYALIGEYGTHTASFWNTHGVRTTGGQKIPRHGATALLAPAGVKGPIFAIFPNFQVIRQYNMSVSYSLAVGHLSDRIAGGAPFTASWPRSDTPMTRANQREIQTLLQKRGFDVGTIDGMIGPKTIEAIQAFQVSEGLLADGYASTRLLNRLRR